jgi:hypothetical protein
MGATKRSSQSLPLTRYTVRAGRHNFRPLMPVIPMRRVRGFAVEFVFGEACWYDIKKVGDHWNKLMGVTSALTWNDHNACMAAWRPMPELGLFSVAGYVNWPGKEKSWRVLGEIEAGESGRVECRFSAGAGWFKMGDMTHALDFVPAKCIRQVGMYFGGKPKAPHWMDIDAAMEYFT